MLGLGASGTPVLLIGVALGDESWHRLGSTIDLEIPVVVVIACAEGDEEVRPQNTGSSCGGREGARRFRLHLDVGQGVWPCSCRFEEVDVGVGDFESVVEEGRGWVAEAAAGGAGRSGEAFPCNVEVPEPLVF